MTDFKKLDEPYEVTCPHCGRKMQRLTDLKSKRCNGCGKSFNPGGKGK